MEENGNSGNNSTQYIRSGNMGNTIDNKQRNTKVEDAMNPDYTNPPLGNKGQQEEPDTGQTGTGHQNENSSDI